MVGVFVCVVWFVCLGDVLWLCVWWLFWVWECVLWVCVCVVCECVVWVRLCMCVW